MKTLGDFAYQALEKHYQKTIKWEKLVKKDEDPEALHQMRVGMRRLRTTVSRFGLYLSLPNSVSAKNIGKIARILGNIRDLDVLKNSLESNYQPYLSKKAQADLPRVFTALARDRQMQATQVEKIFKNEPYKSFKEDCQDWLKKPSYQLLASLPILVALPDLLLPEVSKFFLHPGWLIGTEVVDSQVVVETNWTPVELEQNLQSQAESLHSLRKQTKSMRYQMELFTDLYSEDLAVNISEVKNIQEILGRLQDNIVLNDWLDHILKSEVNHRLGELTTLFAENRYKIWQEWQIVQAKYLKPDIKQGFYMTILQQIKTC
jgi:CHAD domain-containing protein